MRKYLACFAIKYTKRSISKTQELSGHSVDDIADKMIKLYPEMRPMLDKGEIYIDIEEI